MDHTEHLLGCTSFKGNDTCTHTYTYVNLNTHKLFSEHFGLRHAVLTVGVLQPNTLSDRAVLPHLLGTMQQCILIYRGWLVVNNVTDTEGG